MRASSAAKSAARCLVTAATNGGASSTPTPTLLRFPSKPYLSKPSHLSIFPNRCISTGFYERRKGVVGGTRVQHFAPLNARWRDGDGGGGASPSRSAAVVAWSVVTLVMAVANRVLQKLALVHMKDFPFFLAQLNSFACVAVFFTVLHVRYYSGITTDEMLALPKFPFALIGFLECFSSVCGTYAGAMLPGPAIPLLYQTFLVWQLLFSRLLLGRRYCWNQTTGCFLVAAGVVVAVTRFGSNNGMLSGVGAIWPGLMIASSIFQAAASIYKESLFLDAAKSLKGRSLDLFVVNSFACGFQALFTVGLLPIMWSMKGMPLSELPTYFTTGAACFFNITPGYEGAPLLPFLYIASNILFNICILNLLKVSNAITASLAARSSVPIAIYILSRPLPYLPEGVSLSPLFHMGSVILVVGLVLYNLPRKDFDIAQLITKVY